MIPDFNENGELPEGIHEANLEEVKERFCFNERRNLIFYDFLLLLKEFEKIDCKEVYLDGSFVTVINEPKDLDICWGNSEMMNDEFLNIVVKKAPKLVLSSNKFYNCEFYPSYCASIHKNKKIYYIDLFQISKKSENPKGIIKLKL